MATFPDSISLSKIQRPLTRRSMLQSVGAIATLAVVAITPNVSIANPRDDIQKMVRKFERLGCVVMLCPFKDETRIFVGSARGTGCISIAMWKRFNACNYDLFADFLRETGRVQGVS